MKGIILAGGSGTRLYPITNQVIKQLLPVHDKPMIYYPLSTLMLSGIKEILIISTPEALPLFESLFKDGSHLGLSLSYKVQPSPNGLAEAFLLAEDFLDGSDACLILGDNIYHGHGLVDMLKRATKSVKEERKSVIFGYYVNDPERYGVAEFDEAGNVVSIEEKPKNPKSNYAVTGLYFYTGDVVDVAKTIKPSPRGELEITDVNQRYLKEGKLKMELMGRGFAWLDTGTHESLLEASNFIQTIENRQGLKVSCIEEIAYEMGYIDQKKLLELAQPLKKNNYGKYLIRRAKEGIVKR